MAKFDYGRETWTWFSRARGCVASNNKQQTRARQVPGTEMFPERKLLSLHDA